MKTIVLDRADINNPIHPGLYDGILEDLGFTDTDQIDCITLYVQTAVITGMETD